MKIKVFLVLILSVFMLYGCASNISPNYYDSANAGQVAATVHGVVIQARPVQVAHSSGLGALAGGVAGAAGGSAIGGGARSNIIGGVAGAVAGGLLGNYAENKLSSQTGIEYIVKTDAGNVISVMQGPQTVIAVGTPVWVIQGNPARIIPANK